MLEPVVLWNIGQFIAFVILLKYMQVQIRDMGLAMKDCYSKKETVELIDLKLKPQEISLLNVEKDLTEIKLMLNKLLDAKIQ